MNVTDPTQRRLSGGKTDNKSRRACRCFRHALHAQGILSELLRDGFRRADEGDVKVLLEFGFSPLVISQVQYVSARRRNRVCDLVGAHLSGVLQQEMSQAHHQRRLEAILADADRKERDETQQDELISYKAPRDMMARLKGMNYNEFAARRVLLQVTDRGRPHKLSDDERQAIWDRWRAHAALPDAPRLLQVAKDTGIDLRTIWPVLRMALEDQTTPPQKRSTRSPNRVKGAAPAVIDERA